jgi:hypothetical protein
VPVTSYTTADIVLTERKRLEQPLLLLIWLGTTTFNLADGNVLYLISCTLGVGVNWLVVRKNMEIYIRRLFVNIGVILALIVIVLESQLTPISPQVTVGHFMILIQLLKLFERKRARDYIQLLTLNMLLMVTTALICSTLWFAAALVIYILLACYVAMVFTLKRGLDAAGSARLRGEAGPLSPRQVAWNVIRQWPGRSLLRFIWAVTIPALIVGVLAFLLTPRTNSDLLEDAQKRVMSTGFDSSIRLGKPKTIYLSDRIVLRVGVRQKGLKSAQAAPASSRYLRGAVLDAYQNSSWKNVEGGERYLFSRKQAIPLSPALHKDAIHHDIQWMTLGATELFAPYPTVRLDAPKDLNVMFSRSLEYTIRGASRLRKRLQYQTLSFPSPPPDPQQLHCLRWIQGQSGKENATRPGAREFTNRELPGSPPSAVSSTQPSSPEARAWVYLPNRVREHILTKAKEWCADLLEQRRREPGRTEEWNLQIAQCIETNLKRKYDYTLDLSDSSPELDGVEDFLFYLKKGHCEYFASTMAVMCNLLEVPTRVAVGFVMDEYDPDTGQFIVRDRDAHAWCEVYTPQTDWTIFDPTPGGARLEAMDRPWYAFIKDFFQEIQFQWYQQIVGYDLAEQRELSEQATDKAVDAWQVFLRGLMSLKDSFMNLLQRGVVDRILVNFLLILQGFTAMVVLAFVVQHIRRRRRRRRRTFPSRRLFLLNRLLMLLERRGLNVTPDKTLLEQMNLARKQFDLPAERLAALTDLQYRWRWGGREPSSEDLTQAREHFNVLCEYLNAQKRAESKRE